MVTVENEDVDCCCCGLSCGGTTRPAPSEPTTRGNDDGAKVEEAEIGSGEALLLRLGSGMGEVDFAPAAE